MKKSKFIHFKSPRAGELLYDDHKLKSKCVVGISFFGIIINEHLNWILLLKEGARKLASIKGVLYNI